MNGQRTSVVAVQPFRFRAIPVAGFKWTENLSDDEDKHPLLTSRMEAALAILGVFAGIGVALMLGTWTLYSWGAAFCIVAAILIFSLYFEELRSTFRAELWFALVLIVISLGLPILVSMALGSQSEIVGLRKQIAGLTRLRWMPLTGEEISSIKHSVTGTRPTQPTMTIQYLGDNAYDLAESFKRLFKDIGFNPKLLPDALLSPLITLKVDADDSDAELVNKIVISIEDVTKDRIKIDLAFSKNQGQTRIFIGQRPRDEAR